MPTVYLVDDDLPAAETLATALGRAGLDVRRFPDAKSFLDGFGADPEAPERVGCLVLDIRLPGLAGLAALRDLRRRGVGLPAVAITACPEFALAVAAMRAGAADVLDKAAGPAAIRTAVLEAIEADRERRAAEARRRDLAARFAAVSEAEAAVLDGVLEGLSNKAVAGRLDLGMRSVERHKSNALRKLGVKTLAEAARLRAELDAAGPGGTPVARTGPGAAAAGARPTTELEVNLRRGRIGS